jgi:nitrite reductase/ring-hydroxylating ferredoxin subunit
MSMLARHLVYKEKIGVNHARQKLPSKFLPVMTEKELPDGRMCRPWQAMLVKRGGRIFALAETCCSHLGGPLSEGQFDGESLKCPWHGSRFAVEYGSVIDGPTSFAQPCFETRVRAVRIEVRAKR